MFVIIPAGGSGSRLWPLSRGAYPKQLLNLTGSATMIQETVTRLVGTVPMERILILTEQSHADELRAQVPEIPADNFIIEPTRRDTAAVIGLGLTHVLKRDPSAVVAALHADHFITKPAAFIKALRAAEDFAKRHAVIVTMGIHPTAPATCYGYIASGEEFDRSGQTTGFHVRHFTEKPDLPTAEAFLATGRYFWNAGMFIALATTLQAAYEQHAPELWAGLQTIGKQIGTPSEQTTLSRIYPDLPKFPIDIAIMEKSDNMVMIPADIGWSDIGSWDMLKNVLSESPDNLTLGEHIEIDTDNSLIYSQGKRLVATIGLKDMIVVDSDDALLICPIDQAERVKELVNRLKAEKGLEKYV